MTTVYVDLVNGDNDTGDGTAGNPYLTPEYADAGLSGGDEIRVAKSTVTTLSGTLTFTNGSATVSTSADLSGVIAAGDIIGKNSGNEAWWYVSSVDASSITLFHVYWGTSETTTGYVITPTTATSTLWDGLNSGTSRTSRLKVTGGWDLDTETRDGYTACVSSGSYGPFRISSDTEYIEFSYFIGVCTYTSSSYGSFQLEGDYSYYHHLYAVAGYSSVKGVVVYADFCEIANVYVSGGGALLYGSGANSCVFSNIYCYTCYGSGSEIFEFQSTSFCFFDTIEGYNASDHGLEMGYCQEMYFKDLVINTTVSHGVYMSSGCQDIYFKDPTIVNSSAWGILCSAWTPNIYTVYDPTFSGNTSGDVYVNDPTNGYQFPKRFAVLQSGVWTQYGDGYTVIKSDTTNARTGTCIHVAPGQVQTFKAIKVGIVQVASAASDIDMSVYMKSDASFDGEVVMYAVQNGWSIVLPTIKTLTTSYAQYSITVSSADLVVDEWLNLYVGVVGSAGNIYIDDFSIT